MSKTKLHKLGNSETLAKPPLEEPGVGLFAELKRRKRYTLDELIAQCDPKAPLDRDEEWLSAPRIGREQI